MLFLPTLALADNPARAGILVLRLSGLCIRDSLESVTAEIRDGFVYVVDWND